MIKIRKLKIYIDTSVISHLHAEDAPMLMDYSQMLWDEIKGGSYSILLSEIVLLEISRCPQPKKNLLYEYLKQIEYTQVELDDEVATLA